MKRTKQDAQSLRMKTQNAEVVFESLERSYRYYASKLERLDCSHWFYSVHRREYQSKLLTDLSSGER